MIVIAVAWCVGAVVLTVVVFRAASAGSARVLGMPTAPVGLSFVGGLRSRTVTATWPLARLEFHDSGIRLAGSRFPVLGLVVPTWEARYPELAVAGLVRDPFGGRGVRFQCADGGAAIVFLTRRGAEVLNYLEARGVPVDRSVSRLPWIGA